MGLLADTRSLRSRVTDPGLLADTQSLRSRVTDVRQFQEVYASGGVLVLKGNTEEEANE